jgi:hypothetical protein
MVITTDASLEGCGAVYNDSKIGGRWNETERVITTDASLEGWGAVYNDSKIGIYIGNGTCIINSETNICVFVIFTK